MKFYSSFIKRLPGSISATFLWRKRSFSILSLFISLLFLCQINLSYGQQQKVITGIITDQVTHQPLPYASVSIKNVPLGTISNDKGYFSMTVPAAHKNDTVVVNFLGYKQYLAAISAVQPPLRITLFPKSYDIKEVVTRPLPPEEYLKRAIKRIGQNYARDAFQTISFYGETLTENDTLLQDLKGIFKSYYPACKDSGQHLHQLLCYRETIGASSLLGSAGNDATKTETAQEDMNKFNLGGPESVLMFDLINQRPPFLDSTLFTHFSYRFGKHSTYQDKFLVAISFKGKIRPKDSGQGTFEASGLKQAMEGTIYLDPESYAIVALDYTGRILIPFQYQAILSALGISIKDPGYHQVAKYENYGQKWYPKDFRFSRKVGIKKSHLLKAAEKFDIFVNQVFFVSEVKNTHITPIPEDKVFDPKKSMDKQAYNDEHIRWTDINGWTE